LTNVKNRDAKWKESPDINFIYIDAPTDSNRDIKSQLYKYTPYEKTLYIDCDAIITRLGIEAIFDYLTDDNNFVFQHHALWVDGIQYYRLYRDTAKTLKVSLPLRVCLGGFWAFKKTPKAEGFFDLWNQYWKEMGSGRDMPALACAIKNSGISYSLVYRKEHKFFSFGITDDVIVVHRSRANDLYNYYGVPIYQQNKAFDVGHRAYWDMVNFNDKY
jgi:hypothetical protein